MERKLPVPPSVPKAKKKILSEAEQLELENKKLEDRLRELKESLRRQKEARDAKGGYSWKSGRAGGIQSHPGEVLHDNTRRRMEGRRMRILQETDASPRATSRSSSGGAADSHTPPNTKLSSSFLESAHASASGAGSSSSGGGMGVGGGGSLLDGDFDDRGGHESFLQALNEWRSGGTAMTGAGAGTDTAPRSTAKERSDSGGLLSGPAFDEQESHASFVEAVEAWRRNASAGAAGGADGGKSAGGAAEKKAPKMWATGAVDSSSLEIQTDLHDAKENVQDQVVFSSSLSYMERLMLKRGRQLQSAGSSAAPSREPSAAATRVPPVVSDSSLSTGSVSGVSSGEADVIEGGDDDVSGADGEEDLLSLRERAAWLSAQLASMELLVNEGAADLARDSQGMEKGKVVYEFEEVEGSGAENDSGSEAIKGFGAGAKGKGGASKIAGEAASGVMLVSEPDDDNSGGRAGTEGLAGQGVQFVDLKDEIEESMSRAATASRATLAVGPLDNSSSLSLGLVEMDSDDDYGGEGGGISGRGGSGGGGSRGLRSVEYAGSPLVTSAATSSMPSAVGTRASGGAAAALGGGGQAKLARESSARSTGSKPASAVGSARSAVKTPSASAAKSSSATATTTTTIAATATATGTAATAASPKAVRPTTEQRERDRQKSAKMKEAQQALLGSQVTPRRKRSPLPVPGQDQELHRMAADAEALPPVPDSANDDDEEDEEEDGQQDLDETVIAVATTPSRAHVGASITTNTNPSTSTSISATPTSILPSSAQRAGGPRAHEPQPPAALVALSLSMMDDFEEVERNMPTSPTA